MCFDQWCNHIPLKGSLLPFITMDNTYSKQRIGINLLIFFLDVFADEYCLMNYSFFLSVCLLVCLGFSPHWTIFKLYLDVTFTSEELHILTNTQHSCPFISEGSIACQGTSVYNSHLIEQ